MNQPQPTLIDNLRTSQQRMIDLVGPLTEAEFFAPKWGKWSCAETLQHLFLSARPLPRLLSGPRTVFEQWPRSGRPSGSYKAIATAYNRALLANNVTAPANVVARPEDVRVGKTAMLDRFTTVHEALVGSLTGWSADELASYQIPHPVLGLITVGEMVLFTAYHIEHHRTLEADLL